MWIAEAFKKGYTNGVKSSETIKQLEKDCAQWKIIADAHEIASMELRLERDEYIRKHKLVKQKLIDVSMSNGEWIKNAEQLKLENEVLKQEIVDSKLVNNLWVEYR